MTLSGTAQPPLAGDIATACDRDGYFPSSLNTAGDVDAMGSILYIMWYKN